MPNYPSVPTPNVKPSQFGTGLPSGSGVYFVWSGDRVMYVGQARNISARARNTHVKIRASDMLSWIEFEKNQLNFAEAFYIGTLMPTRNFASIKQREFVSISTNQRSDNKKPCYIVTWTVCKGSRKRLSFSDQQKANEEADRIENLLQEGYSTLALIPKGELMSLVMLCKEINESPLKIVQSYLNQRDTAKISSETTVEEAGLSYIASRASNADFSLRHRQTVRQHINRFIAQFGTRHFSSIDHTEVKGYLDKTIGGVGKTRMQHLITIRAFFRWGRDVAQYLPHNLPTSADRVISPKVVKSEHVVYQPEQFIRLLAFSPASMVMFMVLGQLAGIRAEERLRMLWQYWREDEDNKLVLNPDVTKTQKRRRIDVLPSLALWLAAFRGQKNEPMVACSAPFKHTKAISKAANVPWLANALRSGYASYHYELFDDAALTAKNTGHSLNELETTYKSISGVTKKTATEMLLEVTPQSVLEYARQNDLPEPEWASKILEIVVAGTG